MSSTKDKHTQQGELKSTPMEDEYIIDERQKLIRSPKTMPKS